MRGSMNPLRRSSGISLIEVLIALAIFVTSVLAIYGIFPMAMKAVNQGENNLLANQVAKKELEYVKTLSWDQLDNENEAVSSRTPTMVTTTVNGVPRTVSFEPVIRIDPLPDDPTNIKIVRVQVKWTIGSPSGNKIMHVDMETLINNPDQ